MMKLLGNYSNFIASSTLLASPCVLLASSLCHSNSCEGDGCREGDCEEGDSRSVHVKGKRTEETTGDSKWGIKSQSVLLDVTHVDMYANGGASIFMPSVPQAARRAPSSDFAYLDDLLLSAELQLVANAASDRAEMHAILAQQRDNWNKLFQRTLTSTSLTACLLSAGLAASGQLNSGLSLPALLLNSGTAAMMVLINQFQPSKLAEEQRTAARLFRKLASDIHCALQVSPHLRQSTASFFKDCKRRLRALDKAFPMPLTPGGLEKFPSKIVVPVLIEPEEEVEAVDSQYEETHVSSGTDQSINGWSTQLNHDLKLVAATLRGSDIPKYTGWAQNLVKANKGLARAAPCFAASAALLNVIVMSTSSTMAPTSTLSMWAATCSVLATFAGSFSHDMQLGMVLELYRNSAGYYADVETTIKETLRMPVEQRENGNLFRQRIAYQLGRWPSSQTEPVVPADATEAGTLF
ncbi:hypothetical protein L7F22_020042 [Adiantum nelumboides]|nr:hypothetical protein [Adiantum nelumboides]